MRLVLWVLMAGLSVAYARRPLPISPLNPLPLRVLSKSHAKLFDAKGGAVKRGRIETFTPFYVFEQPGTDMAAGEGWYEISTHLDGRNSGWMMAKDLLEWKHSLCITFSHPGSYKERVRDPVLFFKKREILRNIATREESVRELLVNATHKAIAENKISKAFPVISKEPEQLVDWSRNFYLLPILQFEQVTIDEEDGLLLQVASAKPDERSAETIDLPEVRRALGDTGESSLKDLKLNLVFVIDTTQTMGAILPEVNREIVKLANRIQADRDLKDHMKLGVWGFQDKGAAYLTRNFTPDLVGPDVFVERMKHIRRGDDEKDAPEALFQACADAITDTEWESEAEHLLVVITDAPNHVSGSPLNVGGLGVDDIRTLAADRHVRMIALHMDSSPGSENSDLAQQQLRAITRNEGGIADASYFSCAYNDLSGLRDLLGIIVESSSSLLKVAHGGREMTKLKGLRATDVLGKAESSITSDLDGFTESVGRTLRAGLTEYVGAAGEASAPGDILGWVVDRDLRNPYVDPFDVRLLITRDQLDELSRRVRDLLEAASDSKKSAEGFFKSLVAVTSLSSIDPSIIAKAPILEKTPMIPNFIKGLPYKSEVLTLTDEDWRDKSPAQRAEFIDLLEEKLHYYSEVYDQPSCWISLHDGALDGEKIFPLSIDRLP